MKEVADWAPAFLGAIVEGIHVRDACKLAGVGGQMPYERRQMDEVFKAAWKDASESGTEALEAEAARRAYHGTLRPVFHAGEQCGLIREYSDQLLQFLLRSRKPLALGLPGRKWFHSCGSGTPGSGDDCSTGRCGAA